MMIFDGKTITRGTIGAYVRCVCGGEGVEQKGEFCWHEVVANEVD